MTWAFKPSKAKQDNSMEGIQGSSTRSCPKDLPLGARASQPGASPPALALASLWRTQARLCELEDEHTSRNV